MQYIIFPILLIIYFEIFGRWVQSKFNREPFEFSFIIGFVSFIAIMFLTCWPITAFNQSFYLLLIVVVLIFILSIILIVKDIKNISFKFNYKYWFILLLLVCFQTYISSTRTLGEVHGFDTLYYLNMVDLNIGNSALNSLHPHFGTFPNTDVQWMTYIFQSIYYFIPTVIYIFRQLFGVIGISFETLPAYIWGMQIMLNFTFVGTGLICIKKINSRSKIFNISFIILLILFLNNLYYNNSFGFIGNNFRMSYHAISTIILFDYFKTNKRSDLLLFILIQLGICGFSSTGNFSLVFILFALFFVLFNKEKNILKYYSLALYIPIINILVTIVGVNWFLFVGVALFCAFVFLLNDLILKWYQLKAIRYGTIAFATISLVIMSIISSNDLINLHYFVNNYSEIADMSFDYFMFNDIRHVLFNLMLISLYSYFFYKNRKHPFTVVCLILSLVFFNPLGSFYMNEINWVYYRAYDLIINQFTIIFVAYYFYCSIEKETFKIIYTTTVLFISSILACVQIPMYYHDSFRVYENYNALYKISNEELEVINNVRKMIDDYQIEKPKIITSTFYMMSFIDDSTYLYGKEKRYNYERMDDVSYALYLIFFPFDNIYDNFWPNDTPDYANTVEYLEKSDYDILVVEHGLYYENIETGEFLPITSLVESGSKYNKSIYSTAKFAVYYLGE